MAAVERLDTIHLPGQRKPLNSIHIGMQKPQYRYYHRGMPSRGDHTPGKITPSLWGAESGTSRQTAVRPSTNILQHSSEVCGNVHSSAAR